MLNDRYLQNDKIGNTSEIEPGSYIVDNFSQIGLWLYFTWIYNPLERDKCSLMISNLMVLYNFLS